MKNFVAFLKDSDGEFQFNIGELRNIKEKEISFFEESDEKIIIEYLKSFTEKELNRLKTFQNRYSLKTQKERTFFVNKEFEDDIYFENFENSFYIHKDNDEKLEKIVQVLFKYSQIDGAHHKNWCFDKIAKIITGSKENYEKFVLKYMHDNWETYYLRNNKDFEKTIEDIQDNADDYYEWDIGS